MSASASMGVRGGADEMPSPAGGGSGAGNANTGTVKPRVPLSQVDVSGITTKPYTIQSGDTLWGIANKHSTNVTTIKALNNIVGDLIQPGQSINVPASGGIAPGTAPLEQPTTSSSTPVTRQPDNSPVATDYGSAYGTPQ